MICTNCNKELREGWAFCDMCGARAGADPVTTITALAARAGVPAETVLRVILREPTNSDAKEKVAGAVAELGLPDYPRPDGHVDIVRAQEQEVGGDLHDLFAALLEGLARDRKERVDDVALTTQLFREGWTSVDRRLGRLEKMIERLERNMSPNDWGIRRAPQNGGD